MKKSEISHPPKPITNHQSINHQPRIVIQGVRGAFHEIAARQFFGTEIEVVEALSFVELFEKTADPKIADAAVVAIENSIAGSLLNNYNLLQNSDLHIVGEVFLPIRQNLMALPGVLLEDLQEVHSHPIALMQCKEFFKKHPKIRLVESTDTAASAEEIHRKKLKHRGAVAGELAAELYELNILAEAIETNRQNFTRFLAVQRGSFPRVFSPKNVMVGETIPGTVGETIPGTVGERSRTKVSVSFCTLHRPGSLSCVLAMLAENEVNLTKIQSVPILGKPWEYLFFTDFIAASSADLPEILEILEKLAELTVDLKVFGVYKSAIDLVGLEHG